MINPLVTIPLLLSLLTSCSSVQKTSTPRAAGENVVNIDDTLNSRRSIKISKGVVNPLNTESNLLLKQEGERHPVIALYLGPGVYRSGAYIGFIRRLEESRIPVHLVGGQGWGAIVASLYALNGSAKKTEWTFFKLISQVKNDDQILSGPWKRKINRFLKRHFGSTRIQDTKKPLVFSKYNPIADKTSTIKRGPLLKNLLRASWIDGNIYKILERDSRVKVYSEEQMQQLGADIVISLGSLGEKINFKSGSGILVGLFSKLQTIAHKQKQSMSYFIDLNCDQFSLDSWDQLASIVKCGYKNAKGNESTIKEKIVEWQSSHKRR